MQDMRALKMTFYEKVFPDLDPGSQARYCHKLGLRMGK